MIIPLIRISGVEAAIRELDERLAAMREGIERDLNAFGKGAAEEMVETHTFQNRTYRLEESIGYDVDGFGGGNRAQVEVHAEAPYASQVEFGHPGPPPARPYPFFYPVWYKRVPLLDNQLQTTVDAALGGKR